MKQLFKFSTGETVLIDMLATHRKCLRMTVDQVAAKVRSGKWERVLLAPNCEMFAVKGTKPTVNDVPLKYGTHWPTDIRAR